MKILAIDPGFNTGIALVDVDNKTCILRTLNIEETLRFIEEDDLSDIDVILMERIPKDTTNNFQVDIMFRIAEALLLKLFPPILVFSALWKPVAKARRWKVNGAKTDHEQDAYNIARHHMWAYHKIDMGDLT